MSSAACLLNGSDDNFDESKYSADELQAPSWLNNEFFRQVLAEYNNDSTLQVISCVLRPASIKGDHYASIMFRAQVDYQSSEFHDAISMSLIIKTLPEQPGHKRDLLLQSHVFETEIGMYRQVLPKFEQLLAATGDSVQLAPCCIYASLSPHKVIIFEDLELCGYSVLRDRQVNYEEVKLAYIKLAKLHACSFKVLQENPSMLSNFKYGEVHLPNYHNSEMLTTGLTNFIELLNSLPNLKDYTLHFEAMQGKLLQKRYASFVEYWENRQPDAYYVLSHGDFHSKNFMFKNDPLKDKLQDIMLLDYQQSNVTPIVIDIACSLYMVLDSHLRENYYEEFLCFYFENFVRVLKELNYAAEMPSYEQFRKQLKQHWHCEIYMLTTLLPIWYAYRSGTDLEQLMTSNELRRKCYRNPEYMEELHRLLPFYKQMGYFNEN